MGALLAAKASADTEAELLEDAKTLTVRGLKVRVAELTGRPVSADDEAPKPRRRTLTLTVAPEVASALEMTRAFIATADGVRGVDHAVEALLAEGLVTLLARSEPLEVPLALDSHDEALADAWRDQLEAWRREARRECEPRIPGQGGKEDYFMEDIRARVAAAIERALADAPAPEAPPRAPEALDAWLRERARRMGRRDLEVGELAEAFWRADGWRRLGYADEGQYIRERIGLSRAWLEARRTLARRAARLPEVAAAIDSGVLGFEAACLVARVAERRTVQAWLERATRRTVKHLREEVEAAEAIARAGGQRGRGPEPPSDEALASHVDRQRAMVDGRVAALVADGAEDPIQMFAQATTPTADEGAQPRPVEGEHLRPGAGRVTLRLSLREDLVRYWRLVERVFCDSAAPGPFVVHLLASFWRTWLRRDPDAEVAYHHIYDRDLRRCASPVCGRRSVTPHHLQFRSRGGGDEDDNLLSLCVVCHLDGVHGGRIEVAPPATEPRWTLGRRGLLRVVGRELLTH